MALLTLAEAKLQLNLTTDTDDTELQTYIDAVTAPIEEYIGPVEPREVIERHDAESGRRVLVLRTTPVLSVTSVTPLLDGGVSYPVDGLVLDPDTGEIRRRDRGWFRDLLLVTVQAGREETSPTINLAARMLVQHLWRTQRPTRSGGLAGGGEDYSVGQPIPGFGYAVPNRVLELLAPYRLPPGSA
ncbi:head-tail connector protein [Streptomyces sp. NY05-11A]|uniref:head-tail connector protein n=1 Tax=Streptomyces soliscabiei TaxID=588897 RepID=UPI0029B6F847|nr:head-tail connector protein [Streptomyces sp. NY05-11A]MDX2681103.1 phage gp6-like head-tail connector protein [Streptomyces sp. NY05-11A]